MKQDPPTFRVTYNDKGYSDDMPGFTPCRNDKGEWLSSRTVIIQFHKWVNGACMVMKIEEEYSHPDVRSGLVQNRKIDEQWVYDYPNPHDKDMIFPASSQAYQFMAIVEGGLRGAWANDMVQSLYKDIFVMNPKSVLGTHLPRVVSEYKENIAKHCRNWVQESK